MYFSESKSLGLDSTIYKKKNTRYTYDALLCVCACLSLLISKAVQLTNAHENCYTIQKWNEIHNLTKSSTDAIYTYRFAFKFFKTDLEQTQPRLQRIKDDPE